MIGHHVTCTAWHVVVSWKEPQPPKKSFDVEAPRETPVPPALQQRELYVLTATDDGSDVYEIARKQVFSDVGHARAHEFTMVHVRRLFQAQGHALGAFESRVPS